MTTPNDKIRDVLKVWGQWSEFYGQPLPADDQLRQLAQLALVTAHPARVEVERRTCPAHGDSECTWCAQTAPGGLDDDGTCRGCEVFAETGMHWDTCQYRVRTAPPAEQCGAGNLDYPGLRCDRPRGHRMDGDDGGHRDSRQGATWSALVDDGAVRKTSATEYPTPATVALELDAVTGLQTLLEQAAAKLTRVHSTYRGSAVKHADNIASACHRSAALLREMVSDKTSEDSDE